MTQLDAILFDADGVFQRPPIDLAEQLAIALGVEVTQANALTLDLFAAEHAALTGERDLFACVEPVLAKWEAAAGVETFHAVWRQIDVDHTVLALVAELRGAGVFCGLASNQEPRRARVMSVELAYAQAFDAEFYSCHIGFAKPSEAYFHEIVRRAGLNPERTLFIDDRAANVEGAKRAGLHAIQFAPTVIANGASALRELLGSYGL